MSTVTIEIDDYITTSEKQQIARDAFREACQLRSAQDFERILSNAAYHLVQKEVDAAFSGNMIQVVREQAVKVIRDMGATTVFKKPDAWDREASKGWTHLQAALDEAQPLIAQRLAVVIAELDGHEFRESLSERISTAILSELSGA